MDLRHLKVGDEIVVTGGYRKEHYRRAKVTKVGRKYFRVARRKFVKGLLAQKNPTAPTSAVLADKSDRPFLPKEDDFDHDVWKELVLMLLRFNFVDLIVPLLQKLEAKPVFLNIVSANIQLVKGQFEESNKSLDSAITCLENQPESSTQLSEAILTRAGNCFFLKQFYEAEVLFLRYFRSAAQKKNMFDC